LSKAIKQPRWMRNTTPFILIKKNVVEVTDNAPMGDLIDLQELKGKKKTYISITNYLPQKKN
jgi:hypothetical protein